MTLAAADAYCRVLCSQHYENFSVASPFVRGRKRTDLMRFYAYCRTTDDLGDEAHFDASAQLKSWRDEVVAFFAGRRPVHPVLIALRETVAHYALPPQPFLDLISANEQDQEAKTYESWPDLHAYCMLSAAPVGRVVLRIFGIVSGVAERLSDDVCIGLQLANHAQDVRRDKEIGRTYLLQSDLRSGGTVGATRALVERARSLLDSGRALEAMAPPALRLQLSLYRLGGQSICDAIERIGFRTDERRPRVTTLAKARIVAHAAMLLTLHTGKVRNVETA
jgi:squalene synthase HpnC